MIVADRYSAQGCSFKPLPQTHMIDEIHVCFDKAYLPKAKLVVLYLKLYGFQESEESPLSSMQSRYRCKTCLKIYHEKISKCPRCSGEVYEYKLNITTVILEKIGALQAHQEEIIDSKKYLDEFKMIEMKNYLKETEDKWIYDGWHNHKEVK